MGTKQEKIIVCAIEVFSRYGVRRTTMGDIAENAGVSRQTLYASYANKEEVLRAAVTHLTNGTKVEIQAAFEKTSSMSDKLDAYLQLAVMHYYQMLCQMPDAADLVSGFREIGAEELAFAERSKQDMLEVQFRPFEDQLGAHGLTPRAMAELFQTSSSNFKYNADDAEHLSRLLGSLKQTTLVMLGEA
ncbi:MAG: TetR/AcrR family transcriptional regulator [Rhizobiaceae bacterium]